MMNVSGTKDPKLKIFDLKSSIKAKDSRSKIFNLKSSIENSEQHSNPEAGRPRDASTIGKTAILRK